MNNLKVSFKFISPEYAETLLANNSANRRFKNGSIEKFVSDMQDGNWTMCTAAIALYDNGVLADGQNRLSAVVKSGIGQTFIFLTGLPVPWGLNIDTGVSRNIVDALHISGADPDVTNELVAISRGINDGCHTNASAGKYGVRSTSARLEVLNRHREAANWVSAHAPRGKWVRNAAVMAAVGRAWYHETDKDLLARFCDVLGSGLTDGTKGETAAITLRNYLIKYGNVSSGPSWNKAFVQTQFCIDKFMRHEPCSIARGTVNIYELPE